MYFGWRQRNSRGFYFCPNWNSCTLVDAAEINEGQELDRTCEYIYRFLYHQQVLFGFIQKVLNFSDVFSNNSRISVDCNILCFYRNSYDGISMSGNGGYPIHNPNRTIKQNDQSIGFIPWNARHMAFMDTQDSCAVCIHLQETLGFGTESITLWISSNKWPLQLIILAIW